MGLLPLTKGSNHPRGSLPSRPGPIDAVSGVGLTPRRSGVGGGVEISMDGRWGWLEGGGHFG